MSKQAEKFIDSYQTTTWIIHKQAEGLSHADSLLQLPFRGNCFNWVVGHVLVSRDKAIALLAENPVLSDSEAAMYATESVPLTDLETAVSLERLLSLIDETQIRLIGGLNGATPDLLATIVDTDRQQTVADRIAGLHWHETYHVGQLEILRQLAGMDDKVI